MKTRQLKINLAETLLYKHMQGCREEKYSITYNPLYLLYAALIHHE